MGMFGENSCCPCQVPLWTGALIIGLFEFGMAVDMSMLGFEYGGLLAFNSMWFALLFIPSLFYNPNYRKAVFIVFAITTVINILMGLGLVIMGLMAGDDLGQVLSDYMEYGYDCRGEQVALAKELDCERWAVHLYKLDIADPEGLVKTAEAEAKKVEEDVNDAAEDANDAVEDVIPACDGELCDLLELEEYDNHYYYSMAMQTANPEMRLAGDRRAWRWVYDYYLQRDNWMNVSDNTYVCGQGIVDDIPAEWMDVFTLAGKASSTAAWFTYPFLEDKGKGNGRRLFLDALPIDLPIDIPGLSGGVTYYCSHLCWVYVMLTVEWWIMAIVVRAFFTVVMMKFHKESTSAAEAHPCQPLCCAKA